MGAQRIRRPLALLLTLLATAALPTGCECPEYDSPCPTRIDLLDVCVNHEGCATDDKPDPCTNSCILHPSSVFSITLDGIDLTATPDLRIPRLTNAGCVGDTQSGRLTVDVDGEAPSVFVLDEALVFHWDPPLTTAHRLSILYEDGPCVSFAPTFIDADCEAANPAPNCSG